MSRPQVSVVVVSYQVRDLLRSCLASVFAQTGVSREILVVDNASTDGSAAMVEAEFPEARLVRNEQNLGFARANNQALARAGGDVFLLLNPDAELPAGALAELLAVFVRHPDAGCVGFALANPDGSPQPWCHAFPGVLNQMVEVAGMSRLAVRLGFGTPSLAPVPKGGEGVVDWVAGACFAMSHRAYDAVGGLEERLFLYGEEPDWCWRAKTSGFATIGCAAVRVVHRGGASGAQQRGELFVLNLESRLAFLCRHRGAWRAWIAREILTIGSILRLAAWQIRAWTEGGQRSSRTRDQLDRFRAVVAWRFGLSR